LLTERGEKLLEDASHAYQAHKQSLFTCLEDEAASSLIENLETLNRHCVAQLHTREDG